MDSRKKGVPLSQWVYDELKKKIITCEFRPGTIIEEVALSRHLEVSRTPIRSALSHLESENLVYSTPRKGFTVKQLSIKEFVLTMRAELEKVLGRKIKSRLCFGGLVAQQSEFETPVISTDGLLRHGWKPKYTLQSGLRKMLEVSL